jgi:hypothetical protein
LSTVWCWGLWSSGMLSCVAVWCVLLVLPIISGTRWRYKPEGCGFDSRWYHWNFSLT